MVFHFPLETSMGERGDGGGGVGEGVGVRVSVEVGIQP